MDSIPLLVGLWLVAVNAITFAAFGLDKARARNGQRRIREDTLLTLALLGGSPAAFWARSHFRHKTRKQPFSASLATVALLQVMVLGGGLGWWLAG